MPETKARAKKRAKQLGISTANVTKGETGYFIAPAGVTHSNAKRLYADCRSKGKSKAMCAKLAHTLQKKGKS